MIINYLLNKLFNYDHKKVEETLIKRGMEITRTLAQDYINTPGIDIIKVKITLKPRGLKGLLGISQSVSSELKIK